LNKILAYDPTNPILEWSEDLPFSPLDLALHQHYVLLACGDDGLLVFDTTTEFGLPVGVVGWWESPAYKLRMLNGNAVVLSDAGVHTLDLGDPTMPSEIGFLALAGAGQFELRGDLAYASLGENLVELDLSDPAQMQNLRTITGLIPSEGNYPLTAIWPQGDGVYFTAKNFTSYLDLATEQVTWSGAGQWYVRDALVNGGVLGLACGTRGFHLYELGELGLAPASAVVDLDEINILRGKQIDGHFFFFWYFHQVYCFDLRGGDPEFLWTYDFAPQGTTPHTWNRLEVQDGLISIADHQGSVHLLSYDETGYQVLNIFPTGMQQVLSLDRQGDLLAVIAQPLYGIYENAETLFFDVQDPANPQLLSSHGENGFKLVTISGTTVVLHDGNIDTESIRLLDLSDPAAPQAGATVPQYPYGEVTVAGDHLYLVDPPVLMPVDISDPFFPVLGPSMRIPSGYSLVVQDQVGYLPPSDLVFDLSTPMHPEIMGSVAGPHWQGAPFLVAGERYLVVGDGTSFAVLLPHGDGVASAPDTHPRPSSPEEMKLQAVPNPFNPLVAVHFDLKEPGEARLQIYDVRGRQVHTAQQGFDAGKAVFLWDGRDGQGRALSSGVYLARVQQGEKTASKKILLAR
jgi:hypothetical protein